MSQTTAKPTAGAAQRSPSYHWMRTGIMAATDLLFPPRCVACGAECISREDGPLFCDVCDRNLTPSARPSCPRCALNCSETDLAAGDCWNCRGHKWLFREVRSIGPYQGELRSAVLKCKHSLYEPLARALGHRLAESLRQRPFPRQPDLVAPVPLYWLKRLWRGAGAADTFARAVARQVEIRLAAGLLVCRRYLKRQATLTPAERRRNVRGAFRTSRRWHITGRVILLVDDVMTTGATAQEAARALRAAGAAEVFVATVARSTPDFR